MSIVPYATVLEADEYFNSRLNSDAWTEATTGDKEKALKGATRAINNLRFIGQIADPAQSNEFPRYGQSEVPVAVQEATCELALALLDDANIDLEIRNIGATNNQISLVKTGYDKDFVLSHIRNGIVSSEAWMLLLPYLCDPLSLRLVR